MGDRLEYIMAAAMWLDDGEHYDNQPVATGVVLAGFNHASIISTLAVVSAVLAALGGSAFPCRKRTQGFLTSFNRFVDRKEALQIAIAAGQPIHAPADNATAQTQLFSEFIFVDGVRR